MPHPKNAAVRIGDRRTAGAETYMAILTLRDRCYDFLNIFDEKFSKHFGVFCSNYC
jgi:hypothetical protein